MKMYEAVISYSEPCQVMVRVAAESETEAVKKLTEEIEGKVSDFQIDAIMEIAEIQTPVAEIPKLNPEPQFEPLPDNVIVFPGTASKH